MCLKYPLETSFVLFFFFFNRMFSGCEDVQTSADVHDVAKFGLPDATGAGGACTNAVLANLVS